MIVTRVRPKPKYDKGHIPTAISLPTTQFDTLAGQPAGRQVQAAGFLLRRI
jgi:3-mercaptopyruvate sulfurtransferase SseA